MEKTDGQRRGFDLISLVVLLAAFMLAGTFAGGETLTGDSAGYLNASLARDGLYPGFLAIFRLIFGSANYVTAAIYAQDAFLALAVWSLCRYLRRAFRLPDWMAWLSVLMCILGCFAISFVGMKRLIMTHCIMTEGLAMPLVLLSARFMLAAVLEKRFLPLWLALIFVFPSLMLRGQTWFLLVLWLLSAIYVCVVSRAGFGRALLVVAVCAALGIGGSLGGKLLHLCLSGRWESTQFGKTTISAKLMYLADAGDAALFADDDMTQRLFTSVYDKAVVDEDNYAFAEEGFLGRIRHYSGCYNDLLYLNMKPQLTKLYGEDKDMDVLIARNQACAKLVVPLLKAHPDRYIALTLDSTLLGLIRSNSALLLNNEQLPVLFESPLLRTALLGWSALMYALYIVLTILAFRRDRDSRAGRMALFSLVLLLGNIAPNVLAYNVISRYAMPGTLPFYLSLLMLLWELAAGRRSAHAETPEGAVQAR